MCRIAWVQGENVVMGFELFDSFVIIYAKQEEEMLRFIPMAYEIINLITSFVCVFSCIFSDLPTGYPPISTQIFLQSKPRNVKNE